MSEFANYIDKGGFIFILLLTMSALGLTIILYKFFELYFIKKNSFKIDFSLKNCSSILEFDQKLENSSENTFLKEIIHVLNKKTQNHLKTIRFKFYWKKKYKNFRNLCQL